MSEQRSKIVPWSLAIAVSDGSLRCLCASVLTSGGAGRWMDPGVSFPGAGSSAAPFCSAIHPASGAAPARSREGHRKPQ